MPQHVVYEGQRLEHVETLKHDFFAATGLYRGPEGLVVLKLGRQNDVFAWAGSWLGELLTQREVRAYELVQDLPGVPRLIGTIGRHGFLHEYVAGHPLGDDEPVGAEFLEQLRQLISALHARHMAYVDLDKRENILIGDDGRPYLIDFQIALHLPPIGWRRLPPVRWLLACLQQADRYHFLKHKRRLRPDLLTDEERVAVGRIRHWIKLHRWLTRPFINLRRRILRRLRRAEGKGVAGPAAR